jgi:hypothetical protein
MGRDIECLSTFQWLKVIAILSIGLMMAACAPVVYKDAATTYLSAGKNLTKELNGTRDSLAKALDGIRASRIVTDKDCPIAEARVFVRNVPNITFGEYLGRFGDLVKRDECIRLAQCESNAKAGLVSDVCNHACYSKFEGNCLANLELKYAIASKGLSSVDPLAVQANALAEKIQSVEYGRQTVSPNRLMGQSIQILTGYLDLLGKVADGQKSEIPDHAKNLSDGIDSVTKEYSTLAGQQLSAAKQAHRDTIDKQIGAIGKLLGDVEAINKNVKDAEQIKQIVANNAKDVDDIIGTLEAGTEGDSLLAAVWNTEAIRAERNALQTRFSNANGLDERMSRLNEMQSHPFVKGDTALKPLRELFAQLAKSHKALVSLVLDPSNEQLQAIRNEEFQSFRTIAEDLAGLVALAK